ncbi:uncharacterized protein LOC101898113 [Musca domestica]|uniref:Uncharacterized protein LOC101898113 n=1 Tax=Musca domestica TaxID=7370 RepID=A0A1I8MZY9_MUSDO|nr:uncharacterized protein LOC101898113 [Musca domestica]
MQLPSCLQHQRKKSIFFLQTETSFNRDYASNYSLTIANQNSSVNLDLVVSRRISDPVWNLLTMHMTFAKENAWSKIMSFDLNFCELLQQSKTPGFQLLGVWMNNVRKYGELPRECPIREGHYTWRNFKIDKNSIPNFVAKGYYRLGVLMYIRRNDQREMLMNSTVDLMVKNK